MSSMTRFCAHAVHGKSIKAFASLGEYAMIHKANLPRWAKRKERREFKELLRKLQVGYSIPRKILYKTS